MNLHTHSVSFLGVVESFKTVVAHRPKTRRPAACPRDPGYAIRWGLLIWSALLCSACSLLSPVKMDVPCKYRLTCVPSYVPTATKRPITILVTTPDINPVYDTQKMAYTIRPYQIAYYSLNEWAKTPAQMLRPLIVQVLEETGHFKAVAIPPFSGQTDYVLNTEIIEFNQDFTCHLPYFMMVVRAQIIKTASNKIIATKLFSMRMPFPCKPPYGGVLAANHATSIFLQEIALFCLDQTSTTHFASHVP